MSSTNVMEVITRGSFEIEDARGNSRPSSSSTSLSGRPESQLSLEYLPPEEPHYGGLFQAPPSEGEPSLYRPTSITEHQEEDREEATPTSELYNRIHKLSEQVRAELGHLEHLGPQDSSKALAVFVEDQGTHATEPESLPVDGDHTGSQSGGLEDSSEDSPRESTEETTGGSSSFEHQYAPHLSDPKLHRALEKMRKLDAKLADLSKKEKEVKRQRKLLEQQSGGGGGSRALVPLEVDGDTPPGSPVFPTQLDENCSTAGDYSDRLSSADEEGGREGGERRPGSASQEADQERSRQKHQLETQAGVNFIKRNIELASEAGMLVAMTEAEKKRLEDLLTEDTPPPEDVFQPYLLEPPSSTTGFSYNEEDLERMRDIDSRLQALMPPEDWETVCSSSRNSTPALGSELQAEEVETVVSMDKKPNTLGRIGPGEDVLQSFQMTREGRQRLAEIEERLLNIEEARRKEADTMPPLSQSELESLLEQCKSSSERGYDTTTTTSSTDALTQRHTHVDTPEQ